MAKLLGEFDDFVSAAMADGLNEEYDDHLEFLSDCMKTFVDLKNEESDESPNGAKPCK